MLKIKVKISEAKFLSFYTTLSTIHPFALTNQSCENTKNPVFNVCVGATNLQNEQLYLVPAIYSLTWEGCDVRDGIDVLCGLANLDGKS